jgi:hypothetical protein
VDSVVAVERVLAQAGTAQTAHAPRAARTRSGTDGEYGVPHAISSTHLHASTTTRLRVQRGEKGAGLRRCPADARALLAMCARTAPRPS